MRERESSFLALCHFAHCDWDREIDQFLPPNNEFIFFFQFSEMFGRQKCVSRVARGGPRRPRRRRRRRRNRTTTTLGASSGASSTPPSRSSFSFLPQSSWPGLTSQSVARPPMVSSSCHSWDTLTDHRQSNSRFCHFYKFVHCHLYNKTNHCLRLGSL